MEKIWYIDRVTKKEEEEKVYGKIFLDILYGKGLYRKLLSKLFLPLVAKVPFLSKLYGSLQKSSISRHKVKPFIKAFNVKEEEFLQPASAFRSFNDFFIRKLKPETRPIALDSHVAILPADGRYMFFSNVEKTDGFLIKGQKFNLQSLLQDDQLAERYKEGSMVIARLCPIDYHRFHFPCDCIPEKPRLINGYLYSVNPVALKKNIHFLSENKRMITPLCTDHFGTVLFIEVGATYVGSIHQTADPGQHYRKGEEKGFFSFGGSCLVLLFEPGRIQFDEDLLEASKRKIEIRGLFGQSMGHSRLRSSCK